MLPPIPQGLIPVTVQQDRRRRSGVIAADKPHRAPTCVQYEGTPGRDGSDADLGTSHDAIDSRYPVVT